MHNYSSKPTNPEYNMKTRKKKKLGWRMVLKKEEKKSDWWRKAVRKAVLWTWSETSFKQRTKAANMEKKALPVSAETKTRHLAPPALKWSRAVEAHEYRWEADVHIISHQALCTHLLCLSDYQRWDAATWLPGCLLIGRSSREVPITVPVGAGVSLMLGSVLILRWDLV